MSALAAVTQRERVRTFDASTQTFGDVVVAPLTGYAVIGARQQFGASGSTIGGVLTAVHRDLDDGSLVWQQDQEADRPFAKVRPGDLWDALSTSGDSFFAVKISYWLPLR